MKGMFLAVHLPVVVSIMESRTGKEALRDTVVDRICTRIDVDGYTVGKRMDCSAVTTFSTEESGAMEGVRNSDTGRIWRTWGRTSIGNAIKKKAVRKDINWKHEHINYDLLHFNLEKFRFPCRKISNFQKT